MTMADQGATSLLSNKAAQNSTVARGRPGRDAEAYTRNKRDKVKSLREDYSMERPQ